MKSGKTLALFFGITISLLSIQAATAGISATGGTMTYIEDGGTWYRCHVFTNNGTLTVTSGGDVEVLVVGGGGGNTNTGLGYAGGAGGNGIVIIKYLLPPPGSLIAIR